MRCREHMENSQVEWKDQNEKWKKNQCKTRPAAWSRPKCSGVEKVRTVCHKVSFPHCPSYSLQRYFFLDKGILKYGKCSADVSTSVFCIMCTDCCRSQNICPRLQKQKHPHSYKQLLIDRNRTVHFTCQSEVITHQPWETRFALQWADGRLLLIRAERRPVALTLL